MSLYQPYALVRVRLLVNAQYRYHVEWQHFLILFWSGHQNMRHDKTLAVSTCAHHLLNTMYIPTAPDLRNALCALSEVQTRSPFDRRLPHRHPPPHRSPPPALTKYVTQKLDRVCVCVCVCVRVLRARMHRSTCPWLKHTGENTETVPRNASRP